VLSIYWLRTDFLEWIQAQPTHEEATYPQKDIRLSMALNDLFMIVHVIEIVMVFSYSICISKSSYTDLKDRIGMLLLAVVF
jgi:hypothetical protein